MYFNIRISHFKIIAHLGFLYCYCFISGYVYTFNPVLENGLKLGNHSNDWQCLYLIGSKNTILLYTKLVPRELSVCPMHPH